MSNNRPIICTNFRKSNAEITLDKLPEIPKSFTESVIIDNNVYESLSPIIPKKKSSFIVPEDFRKEFQKLEELKKDKEFVIRTELSKREFFLGQKSKDKEKKDLLLDFCGLCYKTCDSSNGEIIDLIYNLGGRIFIVHKDCLTNNYMNIVYMKKFSTAFFGKKSKENKQIYLIPENQFYAECRLFSLINGEFAFLEYKSEDLYKDEEGCLLLLLNNQTNLDIFYKRELYFIPFNEFRLCFKLVDLTYHKINSIECVINLPLDFIQTEDLILESINENLHIQLEFSLLNLDEINFNDSNFSKEFFINHSNYANIYNKIYVLKKISCQRENLISETNVIKSALLRPNSFSTYDSPIHKSIRNSCEDFNSTIEKEIIKYEEIVGNVLKMARTQKGSRLLQVFLSNADINEFNKIFNETKNYIFDIMVDTYANYLFQSLIERCTNDQRNIILKEIENRIFELTFHKKGIFSLQSFISTMNCSEHQNYFFEKIKDKLLDLILDNQATHLVQKIIIKFEEPQILFIYNLILKNFQIIANNSGGVCVIKEIMKRFQENKKFGNEINLFISCVNKNLDFIIQNPFGNYVIQNMIEMFFPHSEIFIILDKILIKVLQLSNQKFSSNVIEKCISNTNKVYKNKFIEEISKDEILLELMKNKYGNFVVKRCLKEGEQIENILLIDSIKKNIPNLHQSILKNNWIEFLGSN